MLADSLPSQPLQTFLDGLLQRTLEYVEGSVWLYHKLNSYCPEIPFLLQFFFLYGLPSSPFPAFILPSLF